MSNKLGQVRIILKGVGDNDGAESSIIANKSLLGDLDNYTNASIDMKSKYVFGSITHNSTFKSIRPYFPFQPGFEYSLQEVRDLCEANEFEAYIAETNLSNITDDVYILTEDGYDIETESENKLIITG